ncbi:hydroxymethylglutaryl-CoA lyase [Terasakiispira papahanaumokuakeensis]|uniref:Hydroxymethylglutaryl-CoA lyase n=1 Tax=Terasakiispira papahanaumokuakeensis TaxID=197479 RepID=A0A1E2V8N9_9GAMM|nr:hydroxymethylglutaryl-CoA lyase [Terasakiispira papahanaumokuakeensis]ODC03025.1 hydroxymethylglutaryl-CoA lyase [Terasakiispira papahanaumokuakeensis]
MNISLFASPLPQAVRVNEVVTRDGFQSEDRFVPTTDKVAMIDRLSNLGLHKIEVTSFVSPKAIPNLSDAAEVMQQITRNPAVTYVALIPNEKGAARAVESQVDEVNLVMSLSEDHNLSNMRMTCAESLAQFERIVQQLSGTGIRINGSLATSFGCPFAGLQPQQKALDMVARYLDSGIETITIADTTGMAGPKQVFELCHDLRQRYPSVDFTLHLHNTRGMGLANVMAGLAAGIDQYDASLGGLGGCPYAPGATGNICTEDLVQMIETLAVDTHVDLNGLVELSRTLPALVGHETPGQVSKAGLCDETRPLSANLQALKEAKLSPHPI